MVLKKKSKQLTGILEEKKKSRKLLAQLPIEKKFEILLQMQKNADQILRARGVKKSKWADNNMYQGFPNQIEECTKVNVTSVRNKILSKQWATWLDPRINEDGSSYFGGGIKISSSLRNKR